MEEIAFSVDSHLLRELGERLVGKPYIALAEIIKNSYDADATEVVIVLDPENDRIEINDNGQGMNFDEFKAFWMRIGSTHKEKQKYSRHLNRRITGSKGVGRLAVQYLADNFDMATVSDKSPTKKLEASVCWKEAIDAGEMMQAKVRYRIRESKDEFQQGTSIVLTGLRQEWDSDYLKKLAQDIWFLRPPFKTGYLGTTAQKFDVRLVSPIKEYGEIFNNQMRGIRDIWEARIAGALTYKEEDSSGEVDFSLEFAGEEPDKLHFAIPNCSLRYCEFEIRVYLLQGRQPLGISVDEAREYLNAWGGVHVYDRGFQLTYYGKPENDWLRIEMDHSHRLAAARLLPEELQEPGALSYLPTNSRLLGAARVDTGIDEQNLHITITRDRLQECKALDDLIYTIRWTLEYYAARKAVRTRKHGKTKRPSERVTRVKQILSSLKGKLSESEIGYIDKEFEEVVQQTREEERENLSKITSLAPFASAGIVAVAYRHQLAQEFERLKDLIEDLKNLRTEDEAISSRIDDLSGDLSDWLRGAQDTNLLFEHLGRTENVSQRGRFEARKFLEQTARRLNSMARGIPIFTNRVERGVYLPSGSDAEWNTIFQNVIINAFNAVIDSEEKRIVISSEKGASGRVSIVFQDTGCGVDLSDSEVLFQPFERRMRISEERKQLGYGGNGLGLTIVRLIADSLGCKVDFIKPDKGYNTAFEISWVES